MTANPPLPPPTAEELAEWDGALGFYERAETFAEVDTRTMRRLIACVRQLETDRTAGLRFAIEEVESLIRHCEACRFVPEYIQGIRRVLVMLQADLERGCLPSTTPVGDALLGEEGKPPSL